MPDDFTSNTSTTGTVAVDGSATGRINRLDFLSDTDWFTVILVAGQTYQIDVKGSPTGDGSLDDPVLVGVYDGSSRFIRGTGNDDGGEGYNSQITYTALADGIHYVSVRGYEDEIGTYTVSVTDVTDTAITDDFAATKDTDGAVTVDGSVTGEIGTAGDHDWFAVDLTARTTYQIDLKGLSTGDGTLWITYLAGVYTSASTSRIAGTEVSGGGDGLNSRLEFTPTSNGIHYVSAGGISSDTGTYRLSVSVKEEVPIVDDHSATRQTTGEVDVDGSVTGEIETGNDRDWFKVELEAGRNYRIDLKGSRTGDGTLEDPYLYGVHDADGNFIADTEDDDGGRGVNSRFKFTPTATGAYYVEAGGYVGETGTYTLSVMDLTDDYSAGTGTTGAVDVDSSVRGEIDYRGDRDWFAVDLEEGATYEIYLEGSPTGNGTLRDPYLRGVYDRNGNRLAGTTDDDGGVDLNSEVTFTAQYSGDHYVAAGGHLGSKGTYTLTVLEGAVRVSVPDDFTAGTGTNGTVTVGGSATGEIDYGGDRDWFEVALIANKTYQIELKGSRTGEGTLGDPFLRGVYDANGDRIAGTGNNNGGAGRNSRVEFTPTATATYYVAAGASGDREGAYTLSVTELAGGRDDFAATTQTTGVVAVGGSTTGEIDFNGDRDWFAVELELRADQTFQFDLEGSRTRAGTLEDPYLYGIHDADGNYIDFTTDDDDGVGYNSRVYFVAREAGTYYVAAGGYGGSTGAYTLSVTEFAGIRPGDDFEAGTGTTGAVAVGGSATGDINYPNDRDWFAVTLEAGKKYEIDLKGSSTGDGTLIDPFLFGIHDANGDLIPGTTNNNNGEGASLNSQVYFTAADAGTYYVAAGGIDGDYVGTYRLSVTEIFDDYLATTQTTGAVAVGGSATGEIEKFGDRDWFRVNLDAGKTYQIDLEGEDTDAGTLPDPFLAGIHKANGDLISGTTNDDGEGFFVDLNSQVTFTAVDAGAYYVAAGSADMAEGTYTLSVIEVM